LTDEELKAEELAFYEDELIKSEYLDTDRQNDEQEEKKERFSEIKIDANTLKEINRENGSRK